MFDFFHWLGISKKGQIARYETTALAEADKRGIGTTGTRGEDDARDAFRHAFVTANVMRDASMHGMPPIGEAQVFYGGRIIELENGLSACPITETTIKRMEMDITNNRLGAKYRFPFDGPSADYAQRLLDQGVLITSPNDAPEVPWVRNRAAEQHARCEQQHTTAR